MCYKSITIQSNYNVHTLLNDNCKLISSPSKTCLILYSTHKLRFSNLCCITVADIESIHKSICMYIMYTFYIYVHVLILMLKKGTRSECESK